METHSRALKQKGKMIEIDTKHGRAHVQVLKHNGRWQYNCFCPPRGGAGFFALFHRRSSKSLCWQAIKAICEQAPFPENTDLTAQFSGVGAEAVVSVTAPQSRIASIQQGISGGGVAFGVPTVSHK